MSGFPCVSSHICESLLFGRGQCFCTSHVCVCVCVCACVRACTHVCDWTGGEESGSSGISLAGDPWERLILVWKMVSAVTRLMSFMRQISRAAPCLEGRMGVGEIPERGPPSLSFPPSPPLPSCLLYFLQCPPPRCDPGQRMDQLLRG